MGVHDHERVAALLSDPLQCERMKPACRPLQCGHPLITTPFQAWQQVAASASLTTLQLL